MKKLILPILTLLLIFNLDLANAQDCATTEYEKYLNAKFPGYAKALEQTHQNSINSIDRLFKVGNDTVYRIPVVFHIVWNTPEQNIHDSLIFSQIKTLNESYRHRHKDTGTVRAIFKPVAGDTKFEFFLATKDPNGNPTNGIDRVQTTRADFGDNTNTFGEAVKSASSSGVDAWNTAKYLNIWVCKFTYLGSLYVSAYAYPPTNAQFWTSGSFVSDNLQGVVVNYQFVGEQNPNDLTPTSLRERTIVHEVGHFFGLRHIWADKQNTCSGQDDGLKDTPFCKTANRSCNSTVNSCFEATGDKPDMTENYMDYSAYPCTKMFTIQQTNLMRYNLLNLRSKLYDLKVTIPNPPPFTAYPKIAVSPNPVKADLRIIFDKMGDYEMTFIDIVGQTVGIEKFTVGENFEYKKPIHLAAGTYYLSIKTDTGFVLKQRILVE